MILVGYLLASTALNVVLGFLVQFKSYRKSLRLTLLALSILFAGHIWLAYASVSNGPSGPFPADRILLALDLAIGIGVLELARQFLRGGEFDLAAWVWGRLRVSLFMLAWTGTIVALILTFVPGLAVPSVEGYEAGLAFHGLGLLIPTVKTLIAIYVLYLLENTYRYAADYQRRIGRLCFIGLASIGIFQVFIFARTLLYSRMPPHFAEASSVTYGIVFPVMLAGFLRYRLGSERITVSRETVYTSATIFLTGAAFLGVALTIIVFRWLHLDFDYFERFLVGFSLCFLAVLVLGSGTMRRRISGFVNQNFYSRKYDYQDQFFRLHKTSMSGADVDTAVTDLVENMKYSVSVDDAYFFMLNWQDGNFYQHENKEESTRRGLVISGDSPLARLFASVNTPLDLLATDGLLLERRQEARNEPLVEQLRIDALFPVFIGDRLSGILALQGGRQNGFDREDLDLIDVFTNSIGDVLFKNRVSTERIQRKQFESFHHISSFIIHDIKNQVATLSLMLKNAERNLDNPSFQTSMLNSVRSCAGNLQNLIDRLSVAPKSTALDFSPHPLRPLLDEVVTNSGLAALAGIGFELSGEETGPVPMDRQGLFFVVRNLVNNALEARRGGQAGGDGFRLAISYGPLGLPVPARLRELFGGGERFFAGYGAFIMVEDSGAGMAKEFMRRRLFQPFATTKEKGVGIGLYQCKTLVEKMGGRILCHSELGVGTEFCILLPARSGE